MIAAPAVSTDRPRRLQRSRRRGSRTPEGAVYVGRPTLFGNPFTSERFGHARATRLHRDWLTGRISALTLEQLGFCPAEVDELLRLRARVRRGLPRLRGRNLVCWCPLTSSWCHANTLLHLANLPEREAASS